MASLRLLLLPLAIVVLAEEQCTNSGCRDEPEDECHGKYSCASWNKVRLCSKTAAGIWMEHLVMRCKSPTPYCDKATGTCSAAPPAEFTHIQPAIQEHDFTCMTDGRFPDPHDCTRMHVCSDPGTLRESFSGKGCVYKIVSGNESCVYNTAECKPFKCAGKSGMKVAYEQDRRIFAYCVYGFRYLVDSCDPIYEFSEARQNCTNCTTPETT